MKKPHPINPVRIIDVSVKNRLRPLNDGTVVSLMESIKGLGLQTPISVRWVKDDNDDDDLLLVAGHHRLEACRRLGWETVPALEFDDEDDARLWEISENLHRADLSVQERADHIAEWVRLTGEKSGATCATKPGAGRGSEGGLRAAVRELGIERTEAQRAVKIAAIPEDVRRAADDAGLNSQKARLEIAKAGDQVAKVHELAAERAHRARLAEAQRASGKPRKSAAAAEALKTPEAIKRAEQKEKRQRRAAERERRKWAERDAAKAAASLAAARFLFERLGAAGVAEFLQLMIGVDWYTTAKSFRPAEPYTAGYLDQDATAETVAKNFAINTAPAVDGGAE